MSNIIILNTLTFIHLEENLYLFTFSVLAQTGVVVKFLVSSLFQCLY